MNIVERIKNLLAHAASAAELGNHDEATLYEAKAIELMTRHAIDRAQINATAGTRRSVETARIEGDELPATYQSAHAVGIVDLVDVLGGYGLWWHDYHSTRVNRIALAIDGVQGFRHLVLGLASIAALEASTINASRRYMGNWVRGFWYGCAIEARRHIQADEHAAAVSKALVVTTAAAKNALVEPGQKVRHYHAPEVSFGYASGAQYGQETYRTFGKAVTS